jgi:hypothetical protein
VKSLDEKKLLARMARNMGQPDLALEESIRKEEALVENLFRLKEIQPIQPSTPILKEELPKPAETNIVPKEQELIKQTVAAISSPKFAKSALPDLQAKEIEGLRKQITDIVQKLGTLSWGSGGTGVVRIFDTDDYDKSSGTDERKFMTFRNGMFQMDFVNPREIISNTAYVTSNSYSVTDNDYYIGVNYNGKANVFLPTGVETGRKFVVKDESGKCSQPLKFIDVRPTGSDTIEGTDFVRLAIDYGSLTFIYRNGWRVI